MSLPSPCFANVSSRKKYVALNVHFMMQAIAFLKSLYYTINNACKLYNNQISSLVPRCLTQMILIMGNFHSCARGLLEQSPRTMSVGSYHPGCTACCSQASTGQHCEPMSRHKYNILYPLTPIWKVNTWFKALPLVQKCFCDIKWYKGIFYC